MNSNILFFEDDLSYLAGAYKYGLSFLRSRFRGENIRALLLTDKGDHLPTGVKKDCDIEEKACPGDFDGLGTVLKDFANSDPNSIHFVYLPCDLPVIKAINEHRLAEICADYSIVVVDWQYGNVLKGNDIRRALDNGQHLFIACSALGKSPDIVDELDPAKWFGTCQKADPNAGQEDKLHSLITRALTLIRRAGKSTTLMRCLGDTNNPLGAYLHPGTTWESLFQGSASLFKNNVVHAREFYNSNLRSILEPEERKEFEGESSNWSFATIEQTIGDYDQTTLREKLEQLLGSSVGLKGNFRADVGGMLSSWATNREPILVEVRRSSNALPASGTAYFYAPAFKSLLQLLEEPGGVQITKSNSDSSWIKYVFSMIQFGKIRKGDPRYNNLLTWTEDTIVSAFRGTEKKSDLWTTCRLLSSYGPLLFERVNNELTVDPYVAVVMKGGTTQLATDEAVRIDFERKPLTELETATIGLRFSFLFWMRTAKVHAKPADDVPSCIGEN